MEILTCDDCERPFKEGSPVVLVTTGFIEKGAFEPDNNEELLHPGCG